ncbi:hypothetical protein [Marivirga sp.]|uniref:hypothetical protein n=1 Tax=Marivirga sp. TaxID=2018662 RepID=UPI002D7E9415|nr:hypothetical protein [Marivirga sp.]HET8859339.1 hypothetical protein [Marivirga sp.]
MTENQNQKTDSMTRDLGMLTGMFHDRESSENAYKKLLEKGYTTDEINLIMPVETRRKHFLGIIKQADFRRFTEVNVTEDSANESTTGVIAGILSSTGTKVVVRGLEIIMAGPIAVGITGSGASGIPGGIVGALVEAGFSKASAYLYEAGIKKGSIVMGVHIMDEEDARDFEPNLHAKKAQEVHH